MNRAKVSAKIIMSNHEQIKNESSKSEHAMQQRLIDEKHMQRAIELAKKGLYTTSPNPMVGCVLVQSDNVIGECYIRSTIYMQSMVSDWNR